jgi:hypothetical protein
MIEHGFLKNNLKDQNKEGHAVEMTSVTGLLNWCVEVNLGKLTEHNQQR